MVGALQQILQHGDLRLKFFCLSDEFVAATNQAIAAESNRHLFRQSGCLYGALL
jgi:hypothetical protein